MKLHKLACTLAMAAAFGAANAKADFTFVLDYGNPGISAYAGPYATVNVHLSSSKQASITFTAYAVGSNIYLFSATGAADVNVNASTFTIANITGITAGSTFKPPSLANADSKNVNGEGKFNQTINNGSGFNTAVHEVSFQITNTSSAWATANDVLTLNNKGYLAAAHIFVTPDPAIKSAGAQASGYAAGAGNLPPADPDRPAPVPPSAILLGLGSLGLLAFTRRKQKTTE